jgi:hypothetical protein
MDLFEQRQRVPVFSVPDQRDKPLDAHMGRAIDFAGGDPSFAHRVGSGDGLWILFINGLSPGKPPIVFVGDVNRADLDTLPAASALGKIYKPGFPVDPCGEVSGRTIKSQERRTGENFDVEMLADLDQFRRNDSHGTVIGGKRFIDLRHFPADG